jgi:DNA polymerase I-like protein with 3'-5' exonuclease and polymerase domains
MVYLVSERTEEYLALKSNAFKLADLNDFIAWVQDKSVFQLDTETLFIEDSPNVNEDRKLVLIQIGDVYKQDQWVIDHTSFKKAIWLVFLKNFFEDINNAFISHNAMFEYTVIRVNLNIRVENLHDTFLMSKILNTGYELETGYHGLAGCLFRFFGIEIDKEEQTKFNFELLSENKIHYASTDVLHLYDLFVKLKELLQSWGLWFLYVRVEREVIKAYADMNIDEMNFDLDHWQSVIDTLKIDDANFEKELNDIMMKDAGLVEYLKSSSKVIGSNLIQPKDQVILNWGSNVTRQEVLTKIIPDLVTIDRFSKPELKKIFKANVLTKKENKLLNLYLTQDFTSLNRYLKFNYKQWLHSNGYFVRKNDILINWSSNVHKLFIFQYYYPQFENTNSKTLARIYANPLINKYKQYVKVHKSVTTYGESFITNYVSRHNTISPRGCRSILNTGRIAFGILLQLPAQARFRNAFLPPDPDWVFVDSDYESAEVAIIAHVAGEQVFLDAIRNGQDAHMKSAALLFNDKWANIAEPGCVQLTTGARCSCPEHEKLRKISKAITFGLIYGLTHVCLAERLDITRTQALELMDNFFKAFPSLKAALEKSANEGMDNNRVTSLAPTNRIRFFHPPLNEGERQAIGRESKNYPIQETCASMLKIAIIKLRKYILQNNFPAKLHLPVHDEILSSCHKDVAEQWVKIQTQAMEEAADMFIEPGLLKADTKIILKWTK